MRLFLSITDASALGLAQVFNPVRAHSPTDQLAGYTRSEQGELGDSGLQFPAGLNRRQRRFWSD